MATNEEKHHDPVNEVKEDTRGQQLEDAEHSAEKPIVAEEGSTTITLKTWLVIFVRSTTDTNLHLSHTDMHISCRFFRRPSVSASGLYLRQVLCKLHLQPSSASLSPMFGLVRTATSVHHNPSLTSCEFLLTRPPTPLVSFSRARTVISSEDASLSFSAMPSAVLDLLLQQHLGLRHSSPPALESQVSVLASVRWPCVLCQS